MRNIVQFYEQNPDNSSLTTQSPEDWEALGQSNAFALFEYLCDVTHLLVLMKHMNYLF